MLGLMQRHPLTISSILRHAARHHADGQILSRQEDGRVHRTNYAETERRARRLARALATLNVRPGDRVATLAMNGHRHLELYYAVSGSGAVCNTVNPRLSLGDIAYIINHAGSGILFADPGFAPLVEQLAPEIGDVVREVVLLCGPEHMREMELVPGMGLRCYEDLLAQAEDDLDWPDLDENTASSLCYTSGTTGRPKGVLYSHRAMCLHGMMMNFADIMALSALDRVLMIVPMFHANAWCLPYAAPMAGADLILPGRHLDPKTLVGLMTSERVTKAAGVPTIWAGILDHLQATGQRVDSVKRLLSGGAALPRPLLAGFEAVGMPVVHGYGMTETGPIAALNTPKPANAALGGDAGLDLRAKQGRAPFGIDFRAEDADGHEVDWDDATQGHLAVRGHWVASAYYRAPETSVGDQGWFPTGDVARIDREGYVSITDRTKDLIKSGGEWISSIALEDVAMSYPGVSEAAAIAAADPKWGERPVLIAAPKPGQSVEPEALRDYFRGRVPNWWVPDLVFVVDGLPHGPTGKVQKQRLREKYREALATLPERV